MPQCNLKVGLNAVQLKHISINISKIQILNETVRSQTFGTDAFALTHAATIIVSGEFPVKYRSYAI
jgi:hypothetical protein